MGEGTGGRYVYGNGWGIMQAWQEGKLRMTKTGGSLSS
jgi:hypothetical protein